MLEKDIQSFIRKLDQLSKSLFTQEELTEYAKIADNSRQSGIDSGKAFDNTSYPLRKADGKKPFRESKRFKYTKTIVTKKNAKLIPTSGEIERIIGYHESGTDRLPRRRTFAFYKTAVTKIQRLFSKRLNEKLKSIFK